MSPIKKIIIPLIYIILSGCNGTKAGNPGGSGKITTNLQINSSDSELDYGSLQNFKIFKNLFNAPLLNIFNINQARAQSNNNVFSDRMGNMVELNKAFLVFNRLSLRTVILQKDPTVPSKVLSSTDVLTKGQEPVFVDLLDQNNGKRLEIEVEKIDFNSALIELMPPSKNTPIPVDGKGNPINLKPTIYFEGTVNGAPFTFISIEPYQIEVSGEELLTPSESGALTILIQLKRIFSQIDLSPVVYEHLDLITVETPPIAGDNYKVCPQWSDGHQNQIYACVRDALRFSAVVGQDQDADFKFNQPNEKFIFDSYMSKQQKDYR